VFALGLGGGKRLSRQTVKQEEFGRIWTTPKGSQSKKKEVGKEKGGWVGEGEIRENLKERTNEKQPADKNGGGKQETQPTQFHVKAEKIPLRNAYFRFHECEKRGKIGAGIRSYYRGRGKKITGARRYWEYSERKTRDRERIQGTKARGKVTEFKV